MVIDFFFFPSKEYLNPFLFETSILEKTARNYSMNYLRFHFVFLLDLCLLMMVMELHFIWFSSKLIFYNTNTGDTFC